MSISPARLLALAQLDQRSLPGWEPLSIRRDLKPKSIDPRDLDLADHVTQGTIKLLLLLQRLTREYSGRKLSQIDEPVQKIFAMSLYQMRELQRVPTHAIVSDAVELTKLVGHRSAASFVNAVLRKAAADNAIGRPLSTRNDAERAEQEFSVPKELFTRLAAIYGSPRALELCSTFNAEPPLLGRLIGNSTIEDLRAQGIEAQPHEQAGIVVLPPLRREQLRELSDSGVLQIQDATSASVIEALDLQAGHVVLDRCAGRGTKTQQIFERVGESGRVVAMDISKARLRSLEQLVQRRQITNVFIRLAGSVSELPAELRGYDRVLIDAPCSNSGVLSRRPEARYHQDARDQEELLATQIQILRDSAEVVSPGGRLLYVTCSIWPEENESLVRAFLDQDNRFELVASRTTALQTAPSPSNYRDGGYFAALRRVR